MRKRRLFMLLLMGMLAGTSAQQMDSLSAAPTAGQTRKVPTGAEKVLCIEYSGNNENAQDYETWGKTVKSYLTDCGDGSLMRFQYAESNDGYVADYYDASYQPLGAKKIPAELPLFGGFYASADNYFLVTGQKNKEQSASVECYRITKYDRDWKRLGSVGLYDCNTTIPFEAGSARMVEVGDFLLIRTCHEMYTSSDGYNHQANATIKLNMNTMQITDSSTDVSRDSYGYVSHSFNQFIREEDGEITMVDHGDAYPRSIVFIRYPGSVSDGRLSSGDCEMTDMLAIPGEIGENYTGVSVGGFEYSDTVWIVAGNKMDFDSSDGRTRNIFVSAISKADGSVTVKELTDYGADDGAVSTPQLVKTGANEFMLLWSLGDSVYYAQLDGNGGLSGKILSLEGSLSDCVPLVDNGKLIWYTWKDTWMTFYEINLEKPSETGKTSVERGHFWERGSVKDHTIPLRCSKCGQKKTIDTPESLMVWWRRQDNTDGSYRSAPTGPFQVGDFIRYWLAPRSKKDPVGSEECADFLLECSDPDALELLPDEDYYGNANMGILRFRKAGRFTLTIRHIYDESLTREYVFNVEGEPTVVTLNKKSVTLNPGKTYTLKYTLTPEGAETDCTWETSNKKVATVKNGKVTAVAVGTTKITVRTANGKTAVCTVIVKNPPESVKLSKTSVTLKKGENFTLKASLTPSNSYTTYTWTSSNIKVAKVKNGKITAVAVGTAKIIVKTANGKTAVCKVTVN